MMIIDSSIATAQDGEIDESVPGKEVQHVIEEGNRGVD